MTDIEEIIRRIADWEKPQRVAPHDGVKVWVFDENGKARLVDGSAWLK